MAPAAEIRRAALACVACGVGGALSLGLRWLGQDGAGAEPGPPQTWVADRDGRAVLGLDRHLLVSARLEIPWPTRLERRKDGGLWVVSAREADPLGSHELLRTTAEGALALRIEVGPVIDLAAADGDDALVVERAGEGSALVRRIAADGRAALESEVADALCVAGAQESVLVGTAGGVVLELGAAPPRRSRLGGSIRDVARGPSPERWWALDGGRGGCRVLLLDSELRVVWQASWEFEAAHLAPLAHAERVWLVGAAQPVACRIGPGGTVELACGPLPQLGLGRAAALDDGGLLVAAPGALLRLDARGRLAPGQGGFDFLTDVAR